MKYVIGQTLPPYHCSSYSLKNCCALIVRLYDARNIKEDFSSCLSSVTYTFPLLHAQPDRCVLEHWRGKLLTVCLCTYGLQPFVGPLSLAQALDFFTQSVGFLVWGISPSQGRCLHTEQHKHRINAHRHTCLKLDSNPHSRCLSGRRQFMP
jgi:hypothetical protein